MVSYKESLGRNLLFCILLLSGTTQALADTAIWIDTGPVLQTTGMSGNLFALDISPGPWGVSLQQIKAADSGRCLFGSQVGGCDAEIESVTRTVMAFREIDGEHLSIGMGVSSIKVEHIGGSIKDEEATGLNVALTKRSLFSRYIGLSGSMYMNFNEIENYYGLRMQLELGLRYRDQALIL